VVAQKYLITKELAGSYEAMIELINQLIDLENAAQ
jgi:hypothetical protein